MKLILICLSLFGAAVASAAPPEIQPKAADALKEAAGLLDQGRFKDAADIFQRADELAGGPCGPCQLGLSRALLALKQADKSAAAARKAVAALRTPDLIGQAWNQLGMALMSRSKPDLAGAEEAFRKAVETGAGSDLASVASYNLADVLWRKKKYAESEQSARAALVADPAGPAARNARIVLCQARADGAPVAPPEARYKETCRDEVQTSDDKVSRPEKIFGADPQYDEQNRFEGVGGTVIVETIIDEDGCVREARVCKGLRPELDRDAWETVRRWVFLPATLEGKPVKVHYTLTVNFIGHRPGPG